MQSKTWNLHTVKTWCIYFYTAMFNI